MKRSQRVSLGLVPIVAAAFLAGCGSPPPKPCIGQSGQVLPDSDCGGAPAGQSTTWWRTRPFGRFYGWHSYGSWWGGGGRSFFDGRSSARGTAGTSRGGFGSTAAGHAGGGS